MNARMYDPKLGRFLQPDSYIQYPDLTEGLNRYTYVRNNPLSLLDPTGNFDHASGAPEPDEYYDRRDYERPEFERSEFNRDTDDSEGREDTDKLQGNRSSREDAAERVYEEYFGSAFGGRLSPDSPEAARVIPVGICIIVTMC